MIDAGMDRRSIKPASKCSPDGRFTSPIAVRSGACVAKLSNRAEKLAIWAKRFMKQHRSPSINNATFRNALQRLSKEPVPNSGVVVGDAVANPVSANGAAEV